MGQVIHGPAEDLLPMLKRLISEGKAVKIRWKNGLYRVVSYGGGKILIMLDHGVSTCWVEESELGPSVALVICN